VSYHLCVGARQCLVGMERVMHVTIEAKALEAAKK